MGNSVLNLFSISRFWYFLFPRNILNTNCMEFYEQQFLGKVRSCLNINVMSNRIIPHSYPHTWVLFNCWENICFIIYTFSVVEGIFLPRTKFKLRLPYIWRYLKQYNSIGMCWTLNKDFIWTVIFNNGIWKVNLWYLSKSSF